MKTRLCHAMQGRGVFVCFGCAAPVVHEKRRQGDALAARGEQPSQRASTSRAGATAADRPPPTRIMPGRARGSPERFVPAADRVRHRQCVIREAERGRAAAAAGEKAVLAELRAIGLSLAASTSVLRPVQARECGDWLMAKRRRIFLGRCSGGGGGGLPRQRHCTRTDTVWGAGDDGIRLLCEEASGASADPLSEHNSAFDIRAVRERIEGVRAKEEATRLMHSLRPSVARKGGEAGPAASPGPAPLPPRGEARARSPPPEGGRRSARGAAAGAAAGSKGRPRGSTPGVAAHTSIEISAGHQ